MTRKTKAFVRKAHRYYELMRPIPHTFPSIEALTSPTTESYPWGGFISFGRCPCVVKYAFPAATLATSMHLSLVPLELTCSKITRGSVERARNRGNFNLADSSIPVFGTTHHIVILTHLQRKFSAHPNGHPRKKMVTCSTRACAIVMDIAIETTILSHLLRLPCKTVGLARCAAEVHSLAVA